MRELLLLSGCEKFAGESKLSAAPSVVGVGCWLSVVEARREEGGGGGRRRRGDCFFS
jgi:hypothetical protein